MKKAITFVCMTALCLALAACGKNDQNAESSTQDSQMTQESTQVQETEEGTEEGTEGTTEEIVDVMPQEGWSKEMEGRLK